MIRDSYTWFFSGTDNRGNGQEVTARQTEHHGVGIVISNFLEPCIKDTANVSNRIITITLKGKQQIAIIGTYAPTAFADEAEKDTFYRDLEATYNKLKHKAATFIVGDLNTRTQCMQEGEEEPIGQHTFNPENTYI